MFGIMFIALSLSLLLAFTANFLNSFYIEIFFTRLVTLFVVMLMLYGIVIFYKLLFNF